jgi:hypothetical protein
MQCNIENAILTRQFTSLVSHYATLNVCMICFNSKFAPPVELCWQNKNISKLGIVIIKVGNIPNYFINKIRKQRNLLDAKMKTAVVKCFKEIKRLTPFFFFILKS